MFGLDWMNNHVCTVIMKPIVMFIFVW